MNLSKHFHYLWKHYKDKTAESEVWDQPPALTTGHNFGFGCLFQEGRRPAPQGPTPAGARNRKRSWEILTLVGETEAHTARHCHHSADFPQLWEETKRRTISPMPGTFQIGLLLNQFYLLLTIILLYTQLPAKHPTYVGAQ